MPSELDPFKGFVYDIDECVSAHWHANKRIIQRVSAQAGASRLATRGRALPMLYPYISHSFARLAWAGRRQAHDTAAVVQRAQEMAVREFYRTSQPIVKQHPLGSNARLGRIALTFHVKSQSPLLLSF